MIHVLCVHVIGRKGPILGQGDIKINIDEIKPVALSIVIYIMQGVSQDIILLEKI